MPKIEELDKNLHIDADVDISDLVFYDVKSETFRVFGLYDYKNQPEYKRMPDEIARGVSEGVFALSRYTSGGRVRFATTSKSVAIKVHVPFVERGTNMSLCGTTAFDMFVEEPRLRIYRHVNTFLPPYETEKGFISRFDFTTEKLRFITINFPLYCPVDKLEIGLDKGAELSAGLDYKSDKPIVYYGSSITQGGCASRPGNSYQNIISRRLELDFINLGFSGNACGEDAMVDYIRSLDMCAFVCDYDHNAPTSEHLQNTHRRMYERFREVQPKTPYIMLSRVDIDSRIDAAPEESVRMTNRQIVFDTYKYAKSQGDENVYFIDGAGIFKGYEDMATVDMCHPNDFGFFLMAKAIGDEIERALTQNSIK